MLDKGLRARLISSFLAGKLKVLSVSPDGVHEWQPVLAVMRADTEGEEIVQVTTDAGSAVLTAGHRVFLSPTVKLEAGELRAGMVTLGGTLRNVSVSSGRRYMFDLTAAQWHNFTLRRSCLVVSNSPDRNYHFRPPAHEETVSQFSRVFGHIWEDVELQEYLERSLDMISAAPPRTPFLGIDQMVQYRPEWRTLLLTGAMMFAIQALRLNWIADEFSYSIGGVSLDLEKSSKYESAFSSLSDQFDKQLEKSKATINVIKGLQQPRFGTGLRSAFGPYSGRGVLSPQKFVGF